MSGNVWDKVVLIGNGSANTSHPFVLNNQGLCSEFVFVDPDEDKANNQQHKRMYVSNSLMIRDGNYDDCKDADIVVLHADIEQKSNETDLDLLIKKARMLHTMVTNVMRSGFNGTLLVATAPVDILTYVVWRFSELPKEQVMEAQSISDLTRFRAVLGREFTNASSADKRHEGKQKLA